SGEPDVAPRRGVRPHRKYRPLLRSAPALRDPGEGSAGQPQQLPLGVIRPPVSLVAAMLAWAMLGPAAAQPLDPASQSALDKTLQILLDPQARSGELSKSSQGTAGDQQGRGLGGARRPPHDA